MDKIKFVCIACGTEEIRNSTPDDPKCRECGNCLIPVESQKQKESEDD